MRTLMVAGATTLLATALVTGCSSSKGSGGSDGDIVIGASTSQTGVYASSGKNVQTGYELAVAQINASGGVLGRKLKLELQNDQSDVAVVGRAYTKFFGSDHVDAALSPYSSGLAGPAAQLADRYKTPMAHSQTASPDIYKNSTYNVMAGLGPSADVLSEVPAFAAQAGYKKISLVNNDITTYKQQCDGAAATAPAAGADIVARVSYAATTSDFSSTALKIAKDRPEVVVLCSAIQDTIGLTRALNQLGFRPKIIVSPTAEDPAFAKAVGSLANRVVAYSIWNQALHLPGSDKFAQGLQDKYHEIGNGQIAGAFASVQVLAAAMKSAGSTDHAKVNKALHSEKFQTILGKYAVTDGGIQTGYKSILDQYLGGKFQIVFPKGAHSVKAQLPY